MRMPLLLSPLIPYAHTHLTSWHQIHFGWRAQQTEPSAASELPSSRHCEEASKDLSILKSKLLTSNLLSQKCCQGGTQLMASPAWLMAFGHQPQFAASRGQGKSSFRTLSTWIAFVLRTSRWRDGLCNVLSSPRARYASAGRRRVMARPASSCMHSERLHATEPHQPLFQFLLRHLFHCYPIRSCFCVAFKEVNNTDEPLPNSVPV